MKIVAFLFLLATSLSSIFAQKKLSDLEKKDFLQDFDLMTNIIREQHPNPYKFIDKKKFDEKVDSLRTLLEMNPNLYNFQILAPLNLIKDVHIGGFLSDEMFWESSLELSYFPLSVYIEKGKVFVNSVTKDIPFGSEIIKINDKPIPLLLKDINTTCDGFSLSCVDKIPLEYVVSILNPTIKFYKITYVSHQEKKPEEKILKSLDYYSYYYLMRKSVMPYNLLEREMSAISSRIIEEKKIGVLTVNTFSITETDAYKKFQKFFKEINQKKYENLIIDIRSNRGGDIGIAALLYSFISERSFINDYKYKTKTIDLAYPEYLITSDNRKYSIEDIQNDKNFMSQRFDKDTLSGFYIGNERLDNTFIRDYPRDKDAFPGNVYVLIGSETISAATYFATLVKKNKRGIILGKETSSGIDATTAAWFIHYQLPNTKTNVSIPRSEIYFFNSTHDRGRGLIPDKELDITLFYNYMLEGKDPEMTYTFDLIRTYK